MSRALALILALVACAPRRAPPPEPAAATAESSDSALITLERTPCFGTCPAYRVALGADGTVRFGGRSHVAHPGPAIIKIPPERVDSLLSELRDGGYFGFANAYVAGAPACGVYATDAPSARTSATLEGVTKRIDHDYGCADAPPALGRLERRIDEVAETSRWVGR